MAVLSRQNAVSQTLEKTNWYNEPAEWKICGKKLTVSVPPNSDYWRIFHYGFTADDAPFYYAAIRRGMEATVKITGDYKARLDQSGMMIRTDHENYIKTGIEFVDGKFNISTVVTHQTSDWSVITLFRPIEHLWIKAVRCLDAVEVFYSFDGKEYHMMRNAWLQINHHVRIGMFAANPRRRRVYRHIHRLQSATSA